MKLEITRDNLKTKEPEQVKEQNNNEDIKALKEEIKALRKDIERIKTPQEDTKDLKEDIKALKSEAIRLKEQNKVAAKELLKTIQVQKKSSAEIVEIIAVVKRFDMFKREIGQRFAEFAEYFENNSSQGSAETKIHYDKLALIVHKYGLVDSKTKGKGKAK